MESSARTRSAVTLGLLALLLLGGFAWGWSAVTEPFPQPEDSPRCVEEEYAEGSRLRPADVLVNVMNSGGRAGLARDTMDALARHGFGAGVRGNATAAEGSVPAQVWTTEPDSPAARLVLSYLGPDAEIVEQATAEEGITVVVGDSFPGVVEGRRGMPVREDVSVCSPYDPVVDG